MKKSVLISLLIFSFIFTGCKDRDEVFSREYIQNNKGRFCDKYAITNIIEEGWNSDVITVYKSKDYNDYVKLFDTKEFSFLGSIIATYENIYFIHTKSQSGLMINAYKLKDGAAFNSEIGENDIYQIYSSYGIKDNHIYIKYKKYVWVNEENSIIDKYRKELEEYSYGKISIDLNNVEEITEEDIPTSFDYNPC